MRKVFWICLIPLLCICSVDAAISDDSSWLRRLYSNRASSSRTFSIELPSPSEAKRRNALQDDVFYCRAASISTKYVDEYMVDLVLNNTKNAPIARSPTILVFGCTSLPVSAQAQRTTYPTWDCASVCKKGERLLWTFSYEAGVESFHLAKNTGFWVGGASEINYVVLQGKYDLREKIDTAAFEEIEKTALNRAAAFNAEASFTNDDTDSRWWRPMVTFTVSRVRPHRLVGVALIENTFGSLAAGSVLTYADASCPFRPTFRAAAQIVAFRVHAHSAGRRITGYLFNGTRSLESGSAVENDRDYDYYDYEAAHKSSRRKTERSGMANFNASAWTVFEIGQRDPRLPQVFVPARPGLVVHPRDALFARCAYDTSSRSIRTEFGARAFDEMCNFFIMYTFDAAELDVESNDYDTYADSNEYAVEGDHRDLIPTFFYCARNDFKRIFEQLVPRLTALAQADASSSQSNAQADVHTAGAFTLERVRVNKSRSVAAGRHLVVDASFRLPESTAARSLSAQLGFATNSGRIGQVCGLTTDSNGHIYIFHRASLSPTRFLDWLSMPRSPRDIKSQTSVNETDSKFPLIAEDTVAVLDSSGALLQSFGAGHFALPRAIHVDAFGAIYLADSYHHSISVFTAADQSKPARVFGASVLCGPSSIVTDTDPESVDQLGLVHDTKDASSSVKFIYVSDGDCLSVSANRVVQFAADGSLVAELRSGLPKGVVLTPNSLGDSLALAAPTRLTLHGPYICVSNREHANLVCWSRRDGALVSAIDMTPLGDRLFASTGVGDVLHTLAGATMYCNSASTQDNRTEPKLDCGTVAGYSIDTRTGDVIDVWNVPFGGFDVPIDVACAADGSFVVVAELYPVATVRKFVPEGQDMTGSTRTLGELMAASLKVDAMRRREKSLVVAKAPIWSLNSVSATGGLLVAFFVITQVTCCAVCVTCCCRKLQSGGICGVKLANRRRAPVKLNVDLSEPLTDNGEGTGVVTDVAQMANDVVAKWRVGIADLKEAVGRSNRSGGAPRRGGFAAIPQYDSETDEIIDTTCAEDVTITGASIRTGPAARPGAATGLGRNGAASGHSRISVNENVRRAAAVDFGASNSRKFRFASKRSDLQEDVTA